MLEQEVRTLLQALVDVPADANAPLKLSSLALVELVQSLEERFAFLVHAKDVVPENFSSVTAIVNFVAATK